MRLIGYVVRIDRAASDRVALDPVHDAVESGVAHRESAARVVPAPHVHDALEAFGCQRVERPVVPLEDVRVRLHDVETVGDHRGHARTPMAPVVV